MLLIAVPELVSRLQRGAYCQLLCWFLRLFGWFGVNLEFSGVDCWVCGAIHAVARLAVVGIIGDHCSAD